MKSFKDRLSAFLSRKFLTAIGTIAFFLLGGVLGKFDWNTVADAIKLIALGYVGIEGIIDIKGK